MFIRLLHTAQVHVATFDEIFARLDPSAQVDHVVVPELLEQAREMGLPSVAEDVKARLGNMASDADAVLCTCSTLGPLVDDTAKTAPHIHPAH